MNNLYPKFLGSILLILSSIMFFNLINATPANGVLMVIKAIGFTAQASYPYAIAVTILLVTLGYFMGFRALIWNRVCIGEQCLISPNDTSGKH